MEAEFRETNCRLFVGCRVSVGPAFFSYWDPFCVASVFGAIDIRSLSQLILTLLHYSSGNTWKMYNCCFLCMIVVFFALSRFAALQTIMTARQLLSILRLSQALARIRFLEGVTSEEVDEVGGDAAHRLCVALKSS